MKDTFLPTLDPAHPFELTPEEAELVRQLHHSFRVSDKLQKHVKCLFTHGCMYAIYNGNLLFHASVPLNADGTLKEVDLNGQRYSGRELLHQIGMTMRAAFNADTPREEKRFAKDYFWYLWCGQDSPLFDKDRMATFERYFLCDKSTHEERKGYYYQLRDNAEVCDRILDAFGVEGKHRHIINGHVPVRVAGGESPIKADGRLMVIDGGLSKAYHNTTGIAGYTLVFHSRGFELIQHEPFESADDAIRRGTDIVSSKQIVELSGRRLRVRDTDKGRELLSQIQELKHLLYAYRHGILKERTRQ
jgi:fructose-1,6-bisphosphatase-3